MKAYRMFCYIAGLFFLLLSDLLLIPIRGESLLAFILVILSVVLFIVAAMFFNNSIIGPVSKLERLLVRVFYLVLGVALIGISVKHCIDEKFSEGSIFMFTVMLIEGLAFIVWAFPIIYNKTADMVKMVPDLNEEIPDLYEKFKDVETPYGKPWLGKVEMTPDTCMIYGPTANDSFIYCYYNSGAFSVVVADKISLLAANEDLESHKLDYTVGLKDRNMGQLQNVIAILYPKMFGEMFEHYVKTSERKWIGQEISISLDNDVYAIDQMFSISKQQYHMVDMNNEAIYDIDSNFIRKTYSIRKTETDTEVVKITKRLFHILPKHDFYVDGSKYGSFRQKIAFTRDLFKMKTQDGVFELREIPATLSANYVVLLDGRIIGVISEKLNLNVRNLLFDNYILVVLDDKYKAQLAGLVIMAERERMRDRSEGA